MSHSMLGKYCSFSFRSCTQLSQALARFTGKRTSATSIGIGRCCVEVHTLKHNRSANTNQCRIFAVSFCFARKCVCECRADNAPFSFYDEPQLAKDMINTESKPAYLLACFSNGYFVYDLIEMIIKFGYKASVAQQRATKALIYKMICATLVTDVLRLYSCDNQGAGELIGHHLLVSNSTFIIFYLLQ